MGEDELLRTMLSGLDADAQRKLLIEAAIARGGKKVATAFGPDATRTAKELRRSYEAFSTTEVFIPGQLVTWKPGLKNRNRPVEGEPAIVVEVLDEPILDEESGPGSTYYRERLDLRLGIYDADGDFLCYHFDSRRFAAFREGQEEEEKP